MTDGPTASPPAIPADSEADEASQFACESCGAMLAFEPGTRELNCGYCGHHNDIPVLDEAVEEQDFHAILADLEASEEVEEVAELNCESCGALVDRPAELAAFDCPFCGHHIVATDATRRLIKPRALLPFAIDRENAQQRFSQWVQGLWFAPAKLKAFARREGKLKGIYLPHWTYDSQTTSQYTGQRGEDYWDTEHYTAHENGKTVRKTRRVRKTRWYSARGVVYVGFDDVLVLASRSLPTSMVEKLEPWDLDKLEAYQDDYVAGFLSEHYQVDVKDGFDVARAKMDPVIRSAIRRDIGGDRQRIHSVHTQHRDVSFKHILLPVWAGAYRFREKIYRYAVNARTGEVQGQRPWSFWKIAFLVLGIAAVVGVVAAGIVLIQS